MSTAHIIILVVAAVSLLLIMVLKFKISAFISLLITSMVVGILAGMPLQDILVSIQTGMGGTLGFVAVVVGLGAIFGQILESSGGAESLAHYLIKKFGSDRASWAMVITGFIVAIPVFLDVGLVILAPIIYALSRDTSLVFSTISLKYPSWPVWRLLTASCPQLRAPLQWLKFWMQSWDGSFSLASSLGFLPPSLPVPFLASIFQGR